MSMDVKIALSQLNKVIADARKVGAVTPETESIVSDVMKTLESERRRKQENIQKTLGELRQIDQFYMLLQTIIGNHARLEMQNQETIRQDAELKKEDEPVKKTGKKSKNNSFVGDKSK